MCYGINVNGWDIKQIHLWIGDTAEGYPQTNKGAPKIGNFPYVSGFCLFFCLFFFYFDFPVFFVYFFFVATQNTKKKTKTHTHTHTHTHKKNKKMEQRLVLK